MAAVFITDDSAALLEERRLFLKARHYNVLCAYNPMGEKWFNVFMSENQDVLIWDLLVPITVIHEDMKILEPLSKVPVVILNRFINDKIHECFVGRNKAAWFIETPNRGTLFK
jgi:hypothetical protein